MASLILGLAAAVFAVLKNFFGMTYMGIVSAILGVAAWVSGDRILDREPRNRKAFIGRMIGVISTIFAAIEIGLVIRMYLTGGTV